MIFKMLKLVFLVLLVGIFTVGCSNILPARMPLDNSIKEILNSKDEDYNFIDDEEFLEIVDEYANTISDIDTNGVQYAIGNLNDDNIPELAVFMDKDPENVNSEVELVIYEFNGDSYVVLDRINMNNDTSNHLLEIGNISKDQKGIFVSNNVGAHSTTTYGFILEDGKLKSILNESIVSLISIYPENEIKDIDDDGILEFSIYTINPETGKDTSENEDDMMSIWYKWDGDDGANVVMTETMIPSTKSSDTKELLKEYNGLSKKDILSHLDENLEDYEINDTTHLLKNYIQSLEEDLNKINLSSILEKLQDDRNIYSLNIDRLNNTNYISGDKILDKDIKQFLVNNLKLGYKLVETEGLLYFIVDNQIFIDKYEPYISREFLNYLDIKAFNTNEPYLKDGSLVIDRDSLAQRIIKIENFRLRFPYSKFLPELNSIYNDYVETFILGSINSPNYDIETNIFSDGSISVFKKVSNDNPKTHFADVLEFVIKGLENNANILSTELKEDFEQKI